MLHTALWPAPVLEWTTRAYRLAWTVLACGEVITHCMVFKFPQVLRVNLVAFQRKSAVDKLVFLRSDQSGSHRLYSCQAHTV